MSRITAVAFVVFALWLGAASTVLAQSQPAAQTSSDTTANCPAPNPPKAGAKTASVYAGLKQLATYTVPDPGDPTKTITVTNLSKKSCTQLCTAADGGGTITGMCVSQGVCGAETTCNGQKPQQVTTQQVQSAVNGSQSSSAVTPNSIVSQEFQTLPNSGAQTPASIVSQNFPQSGSSIPQVSVPPSWLQQVGTAPSENGSASYANQSILTQAFNTLEGNSSGNSTESNTSVPTTPEEYLQSTFGTSPSGALSPPAGENISVNSYAQYLQTLPSGNQAYIIPANDPLNETLTQNLQAAIAVTGTDFSVVAKLPDGSIAVLPGNQYGITNNGYVGVNAAGLNDGRLQGMGLSAALTYFGLAPAPQPLDEKIDYMLEGQTFGTDVSAIFSSQNPTTGTSVGQDVAQLMDDSANHSLGAYVASFGNLGNPQLAISGTMYSAAGEQTSLTDSTAIPFSNVPQPTPAVTVTEIELPPPTAAPTPPEDTPLETPPATQQVPAPLPDPIYVAKLPEPEPFDVTSPEQSAPAPSISAQESAPAGQSSPPEQSPGQTQEAGPQPPAQSAPEALSQSGQPPAQTSQQPDNSGNDQAGGQQKSPDTTQAVGATGGNQANQGGAGQNSGIGAVTSFLGGLLKGIAAVASAPAAQQPLVYSPTAPLATAPASEYGTLGPCPTTTQTNSQQQQQPPCGATSNVPVPQLVASLPTAQVAQGTGGTPPSAQQTNPNIPQTIIPAKTQIQAGSSPVVTKTSEPPTSASGQSSNDTLVNPQGTQPGPTGTSNPAGTQQGGTGAPAATPGNGSSQPTSNPTATSPTTQQQPTTSTQQNTSGQGSGTGNRIGNGSQPGAQAPGSNATNCQTISCWAQQQLNNLKSALGNPGKALAGLFSVGSANAQPYSPQSGQPLADAVNIACKVVGCNAPLIQKAMGGVCAIESACNAQSAHAGSQYQGFGQLGSAETQRAINELYQMAQSPNLSSAEQAEVLSAANAARSYPGNPNANSVLGPWLLVGLHASLGTLPKVSAITNDPRAAAVYLENAQLAPVTFNGAFTGNKVLPPAAVWAYNAQGWMGPFAQGTTVDQAAGRMLSIAGAKVNNGIAYSSQFSPNGSPAPIPASYIFAGASGISAPFGGYKGTHGTPTIQPGNPGYASGTTRIASIPQNAATQKISNTNSQISSLKTQQTGVENQIAAAQYVQTNAGQIANNIAVAQTGIKTINSFGILHPSPSAADKQTMAAGSAAVAQLAGEVRQLGNSALGDKIDAYVNFLHSMTQSQNQTLANQALAVTEGTSLLSQTNSLLQNAKQSAAQLSGLQGQDASLTKQISDLNTSLEQEKQAAANSQQQYYYQDPQSGITGECAAGMSQADCAKAASQDVAIERAAQALKQQGASLPQGAQFQTFTAVAQNNNLSTTGSVTQSAYTIKDQSGTVVAQNVQLPQGSVGADGTVQLLADANGNPLGQDGKTLQSGAMPLSAGLPQSTPDPTNPTQLDFADNRPTQPAPPPQTAGLQIPPQNPLLTATRVGQPSAGVYAQPPSQAYPQPIQQPLPYPAPASSTQNPAPMVNIAANPQSVASGKTSTITWNSLGTTQCNVVSSTGTTLSSTSTKGTIVSPQLSATTVFTAQCQAQITTTVGVANTTISASTSVTVQ